MRALDRWILPYLRQCARPRPPVRRVFIAVADHFEPFHRKDRPGALERMKRWCGEFPRAIEGLKDSGGRAPRHTFFYPIEQHDEEVVGQVMGLSRATGSEMEVHLHHEKDTEETLLAKLQEGVQRFASQGVLSRHPDGRPAYAFVHGDWALANSGPGGQCCGVAHEIDVLLKTGCYADFTFPSAPDPSQPRRINSLYYIRDTGSPATLDQGPFVARGRQGPADHLLLVQGVLALNWHRRKWGVFPRVENSDITGANPPTRDRFHLWLCHAPRIAGREDWAIVKLHSHGAVEANSAVFLGERMKNFHRYLCEDWAARDGHALHYVTAREMVNVIRAAESGAGDFEPSQLDFCYPRPAISL